MKTFFGTVQHVFYMANKVHIIWCAGILLTMLVLAVLHHKWRYDDQKLSLWRLLCFSPLLLAIVHFVIYVSGCTAIVSYFLGLYILAILALVPMLFAKRRIGYPVTAALVGIVSVLCGFYFCATSPNVSNFSGKSYTDSFHALVEQMNQKYILKEWKTVNFHELEEKYMPLVEVAQQEQDPAKFADAVTQFCNELHDGHVSVEIDYDFSQYTTELNQHEYGLAMMKLDNGDVIAVCTTDEVHSLGIEDGTIITKWNSKPVLQAAEEDVWDMGIPVKANADRLNLMYLSGIGGETVDVSFIDKSGKERNTTLLALDEKSTFREAFAAFSHRPVFETQEDYEAYAAENFSTKMLNDKCGYLVLNAEDTSNGFQDTMGYLTGNHKWAREMFREKLRELKSQGMEYLIIDLRNNMGGLDEIGCALTDLLTEDEYYGQGPGIRKNGEYTCVSDHGIYGDGEFADLQAVALTNFNCASAGDGTALYLSKLPNVTLAGITDPNGCNQETGGVCVLADAIVTVYYPTGLILDENGEPNIDTRADRVSRNPVEVRIPLDRDAAMKIFRDKEDHELDWALKYLEQNSGK